MDILKKFLSRKFLAAAAGTTIGAAVALLGLDQSIIASLHSVLHGADRLLDGLGVDLALSADVHQDRGAGHGRAEETIVDSDGGVKQIDRK